MTHRSTFRDRVHGTIVPMPTPFHADGSIDFEGVRRYTNFLIESGIQTISPLGTTGEFYAMTLEEHQDVMRTVVETAAGRATVIAGAGHSGTRVASGLVRYAQEIGADAVLVCPPYYLPATPEAVVAHYRVLAEENDIGIVVYSNRDFMVNLDLVDQLVQLENIVAVKEASGSFPFYKDWCLHYGEQVTVIGGGSMQHYLWGQLWGSPAYFASVANFIPAVELDFFSKLTQGDVQGAKQIVVDYEKPFMEVALKYNYWASLKVAMELMGLPAGPPRLPMLPVPEQGRRELQALLERLGWMPVRVV